MGRGSRWEERRVGVGEVGLVAFGVGEEVAVEVGDEGFALGFFEGEERGLVEGAGDFLHEVEGELAGLLIVV
jgi:hypothetical protein